MDGHIVYYPDNFQYDDTPVFSEEWLWREYWDKGLSVASISDECGVSQYYIESLFVEYGIPKRKPVGAYLSWKATNRITGLMQSGKLSTERTSIELALYGELDRLHIGHTPQYSPQGYSRIYDAFVHPDILVEMQGDYWHSRPEQQIVDEHKEAWAYDHGYKYAVIWECEIKEIGIGQLVADRILIHMKGKDNEYSS